MSDYDRIKGSFWRVVLRLMNRLDYSCFYGATVAGQNADGTLELVPATAKLAPLSKVPIRYGIPGISVLVNAGALALVGFENANPKAYYALLVGSASIQSLAFLDGQQPLARQGDAVSVGPLPATMQFVGTIGGLPATGVMTVPPVQAMGVIVTGRKEVTA